MARTAERHRDVDRGRLADRPRRPAGRREAARGAVRATTRRELSDPRHFAYWRRAADVVTARVGLDATPGLRAPRLTSVEEDAEGITLVQDWVEDAANSGLFSAISLGRFAGADLGDHAWLAQGQLRDRLARVERRGGWPTLARTTVADVADHLWRRRAALLDELDALPQVAQHGDPAPVNLPGRDGDDVVAIDWGTLGRGPVGADLGLFMLGAREEFEPLLDAYLLGLPDGRGDPRPGRAGGARHRRADRAQSRGVGAGPGRGR